jgi:hypothetical protein
VDGQQSNLKFEKIEKNYRVSLKKNHKYLQKFYHPNLCSRFHRRLEPVKVEERLAVPTIKQASGQVILTL